MKLHRIISILVCIMLLACAGAWADGKQDDLSEDGICRFIMDRFGSIVITDDDIPFSADADISGRILTGTDEAENINVERRGDGIFSFSAEGLAAGSVYEMEIWESGEEDTAAVLRFMPVEFVEIDAEKTMQANADSTICLYPVEENIYAAGVYTEADTIEWHFMINVDEDHDVRCTVSDSDNDEFDNERSEDIAFSRTSLLSRTDFGPDGERTISFRCGEDYAVEYRITIYGSEEELENACGEYSAAQDDVISEEEEDDSEKIVPEWEFGGDTDAEPTEVPAEVITEDSEDEAAEEPEASDEPEESEVIEAEPEVTAPPETEDEAEADIGQITLYSVETDDSGDEFEIIYEDDGTLRVCVYAGHTYIFGGTCTEGVEPDAKVGIQPLNVKQTGNEWSFSLTPATDASQTVRIFDVNGSAADVVCTVEFIDEPVIQEPTEEPDEQDAENADDDAEDGGEADDHVQQEEVIEEIADTECDDIVCGDIYEGDEKIRGTTEPGAEVKLYIDFDAKNCMIVTADEYGFFEFDGLYVELDANYSIKATDASGNYKYKIATVKEYSGSYDDIEITLDMGGETEALLGSVNEGISIEISARGKCAVQLYVSYNGGEPEPLGNALVPDDAASAGSGYGFAPVIITAEQTAEMADGIYEITAGYDGMFAGYRSDALTVEIDTEAPEAPMFTAAEIADDAGIIEYSVAENCRAELMIDGECVDNREATAGENTFYALPQLVSGMRISIAAEDEAGNRSVSGEMIVLPSDFIGAITADIPDEYDAFMPVEIGGSYLTLDENAAAEVMICFGDSRMSAVMDQQQIAPADSDEFEYRIDFSTLPIDMGDYPCNSDITVEIYVTADGERELLLTDSFRLAKNSGQLTLKAALFIMILCGFAAAVATLTKVNRHMVTLRKAALNAGNDSNLTMRRRGYDRAEK